jgi:hypothetical protein
MNLPEGYKKVRSFIDNAGTICTYDSETEIVTTIGDLEYALYQLREIAGALNDVLPWVQPPDGIGSSEDVFDAVNDKITKAEKVLERYRNWK